MKLFRLLFFVVLAALLSGAVLLRTFKPDHRAAVWIEVSQAKLEFALRRAGMSTAAAGRTGQKRLLSWKLAFDQNLEQINKNVFTYRVVAVDGSYRVSEQDIIRATGLDKETSILKVTPADIARTIDALPWVEQHNLSWSLYPLRLRIAIEEAEPWLVAEYGGHSWLLSRKNKLIVPLDSLAESELIMEASTLARVGGLRGEQEFSSYLSSENARLRYATKMISFLEMAKSLPFAVERYELQTDGSLLVSPEPFARSPAVRLQANSFEQAEEIRRQLSTVLEDLKNRGEGVELVDLRFKNQAVVR